MSSGSSERTTRAAARRPAGLDRTITIAAPPARILGAFFDAQALAVWWQVRRAVTTPRTLGAYAVEWAPTDFTDGLLGRLGGVFHGTVIQYQAGRSFFVADAYWLPPDGEPIGPMALDVTCKTVDARGWMRLRRPGSQENVARLHVVQNGYEDSPRWRRYYEVIDSGWARALDSLKAYLEHQRPAS
ncbi:MAG TPA: SRPBCC domain-containing protein [Vicinamibacterales bacterium]|nr:SRPBCC domain-containing protein [Vicinamibacterales bacterium]